MEGCCVKYGIKYPFVIISFVFSIIGLIILGCGIQMHVAYNNGANFAELNFFTGPPLLITVGSIIFLVSFLGCWGALEESHSKMITFSTILLVVFLLEVAGVIACYVMRADLEVVVKNNMEKGLQEYPTNPEMQKIWNIMQHEMSCCGVVGPSDWNNVGNKTIPNSCCRELPLDASNHAQECTTLEAHKDGCFPLLINTLKHMSKMLGMIALGLAIFQIVVISSSCLLARSIRRDYQTV